MANNYWLITTIAGSTVNYYLSGGGASQTPYSGSGTPWTAQATTPYEIAMNDVTGQRWTPQIPPQVPILGGGAPLGLGQTVLGTGYNSVTEQVPIQLKGATHNSAVFLLRQLRQILNQASFSVPAVLAVQPNGSTNVTYYEILYGDVQEDPRFINDEAGSGVMRALITWTRTPFGGNLSTGETVLNGVLYTNTGTGANNNTQAFSAGTGELVYEGQPLNLTYGTSSTTVCTQLYAASVYKRTYGTTGTGVSIPFSNTTYTLGITQIVCDSFEVTSLLTNASLKIRFVPHFSSSNPTAMRLRFRVVTSTSGTTNTLFTSAEVTPSSTNPQYLDMGFITNYVRRTKGITSPVLYLILDYRSPSGAATDITLNSVDILYYYTFCRISGGGAIFGSTNTLTGYVDCFPEQTNAPCLPYPTPKVYSQYAGGDFSPAVPIIGTPPRYYSGASLWTAWGTASAWTKTHQVVITATNAPLYRTLRGNG